MNARTSTISPVLDAITLAAFVAIIGALAVVLAAGRAHAATVAVTPAQATCQAFATWERHESAAGLDRIVIASARLGRSWLKADAGQLYADASSPSVKAVKYVRKDREYVSEDCAKL